jgi:hypothetical protein
MIDTITFNLHSVSKELINLTPLPKNDYNFNKLLYERLCEYTSNYIKRYKKFTDNSVVENIKANEYFKRTKIISQGIVKRKGAIYESLDKKEMYFEPIRGDFSSPSSEYRTKFSINENTDTIQFELSIPKYLYNNNISQFVPNVDSDRFKKNVFLNREFRFQSKQLHKRLIEFIYTFFNDLSVLFDMPLIQQFDIRLIEIKRIDFCYNQIFSSYDMVIDYLTAQRKFYKSKVRKNTIVADDRTTSFYYRHSTDGFYFKIYAKYDEFMHSDFPRLLKENQNYFDSNLEQIMPFAKQIFKKHFESTYKKTIGRVEDLIFDYYKTYVQTSEHNDFCKDLEQIFPYKLLFLIAESKQILRYEMSYTRTYISTLYKKHIFRKSCPHWKKLLFNHDLIKRYDLKLSQGSINGARDFKIKHRISKHLRNDYELIQKSLNKKHEFHLVTDKQLINHETNFLDHLKNTEFRNYRCVEEKKATFSESLILLLTKKFFEEMEYFQPKMIDKNNSVLEQIDLYNKKVDSNIKSYITAFGENNFKKLTHTKKREKNLSKINRSRIKQITDYIDSGISFDDSVKKMGFKKTAIYTLKRDLELFNYYRTTIKTKYNFKNIKLDYYKYYEKFLTQNSYHRNLFVNPQMISFDSLRNSALQDFLSESVSSRLKKINNVILN